MIKIEDLEKYENFLPFIGYLGFFLLQIVTGIVLISGNQPLTFGLLDLPQYQPLTYFDLIILLGMNIPTFILIGMALKRLFQTEID